MNIQDVFTPVGAHGALGFYCAGCKQIHVIADQHSIANGTLTKDSNIWQWNGDKITPSVKPSLSFTSENGRVCHSFILNGEIHYLEGCTHELRGTFVKLEPPPREN